MISYRDRLWFLLDEWINDAEIKCVEYDSQLSFVKENSLNIYYLQFITPTVQNVDFLLKILKIYKM